MERPRLAWTFWLGLLLIAVSEAFLWWDVMQRGGLIVDRSLPATALPAPTTEIGHVARWFAVNVTALCWLGYLGVFDGLLQRFRKPASLSAANAGAVQAGEGSPIRARPNRFIVAWLTSIPVWCFFDTVNFYFMDAWRYHGLPEPFASRLIGYFIAFAAISPGMFLAAELYQRLGLRRVRVVGRDEPTQARNGTIAWVLVVVPPLIIAGLVTALLIGRDDELASPMSVAGSALLLVGPGLAAWYRQRMRSVTAVAFGVSFLLWTFLARDPLSNFTLWTGLIYLLDPFNKMLGAPSLLGDWQQGRYGRTLALAAGGATCGLLWEFWNYWAVAKWTYHLPFLGGLESITYFEMPALGFSGFLPFAAECWVVLNTILLLFWRFNLHVAEPLPDEDAVI
jgi:hypothetical protein